MFLQKKPPESSPGPSPGPAATGCPQAAPTAPHALPTHPCKRGSPGGGTHQRTVSTGPAPKTDLAACEAATRKPVPPKLGGLGVFAGMGEEAASCEGARRPPALAPQKLETRGRGVYMQIDVYKNIDVRS